MDKSDLLWMQDWALAGARFDGAIDTTTDYKTGTIALPALSANDPDTAANELRTNLIVTGSAADGNEGMFSLGELLGAGMATDQGSRYVASAHDTISKVRSDVAALLALATPPSGLDGILETQWSKLEAALDTVFKTSSALDTGATSAVRLTAPREEDILDEIDDILDALASEDAFVAATADGGGGVFASQGLGAGAATDAFNRVQWSATATMGTTGATRYGTAIRKTTANARDGLSTAEVGAFSYSTMAETLRTSLAAAVSLTGIASYTGGTEAISGGGTAYSGTMDLQVRFAANTVSGVVKDLLDADGMPWQHNFADVERIVLTDATLRRNATFTGSGSGTDGATVFFTADSGLLRPITGLQNTLSGILLGTGADAGTQANGVWSVNASGSTNFLTGGFGVMHVGDASRPRPEGDTGGSSNAKLITTATAEGVTTPGVTVADGKLTVKVQRYGYVRSDNETPDDPSDDTISYAGRTNDDGAAVLATAAFDLEALAGAGAGAKTTVNGPTHVAGVKATLQAQRDQIATLQSLGTRTASTRGAEAAAWQIVQDAIQYQLLREQIPVKLAGAYDESEALDLIDRAIDALSNTTALFAALDPSGTGVFDHYSVDLNDDDDAIDTGLDDLSEVTLNRDLNGDGDRLDEDVDGVSEVGIGNFINWAMRLTPATTICCG